MSMIELQLGLAPPFTTSSTESTSSSSLDLNIRSFNCHVLEKKKMKNKVIDPSSHDLSDGEGYGSPLSTHDDYYGTVEDDGDDEDSNLLKKKRGFDQAFDNNYDHDALPRALPLLVWNKQPSDEDDHPEINCFAPNKIENGRDGDSVVGWPPIHSYRRKLCHHQNSFPRAAANDDAAAEDNYGGGGRSGSMLVKVQMEGVMITRKIDMSRHRSYETLTHSLCTIFGTGIDGYTLTYLDKEGDWLLAGDVPWRAFVQSVRRLKLLRRRIG